MLVLLLCQLHGFVVVLQVFAHFDGSFNVKKIAFETAFRKEMAQIINFLLFHVAVEQQSGVLLLSLLLLVDFLKILNEVVNLGNIEEAPNHIRWLYETESECVLPDRTRKITFRVKQISVQSGYLSK
jgi:hypothetical protein